MNGSMTPKQVTEQLDLTTETLKKYSLLLEKAGMDVERNKRGHRQYSEGNLQLIKALMFLNKEKSVNLEDAAEMVTSSDFDFEIMNGTTTVTDNGVITLQHNGIPLQNELATTVMNQLQLLQSKLELQDQRDIEFQKIVTNRLEEQRNLIVKQEEALEKLSQQLEEENNKSFWQKLFGK
ncbi:MerR family transcriptional regulator [Solibacillus sp.]|uniref:MerR family transcriptional regulator n=1 Tax=Solibacillus sp. TaxID=1909654 RepID=UPI003314FA98